MENQNKSVVYIYSSQAVINLNIILPFYLPYFGFFYSHHLIINLPLDLFHSMHIFPIQKGSHTLSLSLNFFFSFFVGFIIIIFLAFLPQIDEYFYFFQNSTYCQVLRIFLEFYFLKMFIVKLELSNCRKLLFTFCQARSIESQTQLNKARADCFFADFSNLAQAHMMCRVLCFALSIKR